MAVPPRRFCPVRTMVWLPRVRGAVKYLNVPSACTSAKENASAQAADAICTGLHELAGLPAAHASLLSTALVGMAQVAAATRYRSARDGEPEVDIEETIDLITQVAWRGVAGLVKERPEPRA